MISSIPNNRNHNSSNINLNNSIRPHSSIRTSSHGPQVASHPGKHHEQHQNGQYHSHPQNGQYLSHGLPAGGVEGPHHPHHQVSVSPIARLRAEIGPQNQDMINATNQRYTELRNRARHEEDEAHK